MATDDRIRDTLARSAATIEPDLGQSRAAVQRRAQRLGTRRRAIVALTAAIAVLAVVLAATQLDEWTGRSDGIGPAVTRESSAPKPNPKTLGVPNPFTITRTFHPADLGLQHPLRVAPAPNGDLYITDTAQTVTEVTPDGKVVRRWGRPGTGPGEFRLAAGGIAVGDDGRVYVADTGNFRVQVFSPTGRFLSQFGSFGSGEAQFLWPSDLAVGADGAVYVTDDRSATVSQISAQGRELWRLGDAGTSDGDLVGHEHLADVDARGRLIMANDDKGRVVYLDADGHKVDAFGSGSAAGLGTGSHPRRADFPDGACDATIDPAGYVYVTSCQEPEERFHNTEVFDPGHRLVGAWVDGPFSISPRFARDGEAFVVSHDGSILVLSVSNP